MSDDDPAKFPVQSPLYFSSDDLLRRWNTIPMEQFHIDNKLTQVLNAIDARRYSEARIDWILHVGSMFGYSESDNVDQSSWDLMSDTGVFTQACRLFRLTINTEYGPCTKEGKVHTECALVTDTIIIEQLLVINTVRYKFEVPCCTIVR